jgi:signal transduction histidine kinase
MEGQDCERGRLTGRLGVEIRYHRYMNVWLVLIAVPDFLTFALFYYLRDSYLQAGIFAALALNALVALLLVQPLIRSPNQENTKKLIWIKQMGTAIAFALLALSIVVGVLSSDIYISYPWIFFFPVCASLFFGGRVGIGCSALFSAAMVIVIFQIDFPAWNDALMRVFKIHSSLTLLSILIVAGLSERARVRMRNHLLEARNLYKEAEARQRHTNAELKSEIEMRLESERALAQSETRYRALFEESSVSMWEENWARVKTAIDALPPEARQDLDTYLKAHPQEVQRLIKLVWITAVNRSTLKLCAAESFEHFLKNIWQIMPPDIETYFIQRVAATHRSGRFDGQLTARTIAGQGLHLLVTSAIPAGYEASWERVYSSFYDITERVAMEEEKKRVEFQMQHTRQIQAVASLAGGIAHQFNNALAVIMGNLDLMELDPQGPGKGSRSVGGLRASTERMRGLTEQLLAYARGGKYQPKDFSINELILNVLKSSKAARTPHIHILTHLEADVTLCGADSTQIRNVLEAVLDNAVEAMPNGGDVSIATCYQRLAEGPKGPDGALPPGIYAAITIADQGIGMDEETRRRIFEPFFSTKFVGRGLSMAAAYGIVRNHDGMIQVQSTPNQGTRVTIILPGTRVPTAKPMAGPCQRAA